MLFRSSRYLRSSFSLSLADIGLSSSMRSMNCSLLTLGSLIRGIFCAARALLSSTSRSAFSLRRPATPVSYVPVRAAPDASEGAPERDGALADPPRPQLEVRVDDDEQVDERQPAEEVVVLLREVVRRAVARRVARRGEGRHAWSWV